MDDLRHRLVIDNFSFLLPASKLPIGGICDKSRVGHAKEDARVRGPRVLSRGSLCSPKNGQLARKLSFLRNHVARKGEVLIILGCISFKDVDVCDFKD